MKRVSLLIYNLFCFLALTAQQTIIQYLSGIDKDHTVSWEFMCTKGRNSGKWSSIPVPSNWEMQGFGTYNYYKDLQNPDEQGLYKTSFSVSPAFKNKKVFIVFDGSMTDTEVKINGKSAGPLHQGGFYQFRYNITDLVLFGKSNLLEVTVSKHSANYSVNQAERKADFWLFGGIFRPVFLEIVPEQFFERVAIDAKANGEFSMQVFNNRKINQSLKATVFNLNGIPVEKSFTIGKEDSVFHHSFKGIQMWNPEMPHLYYISVDLMEGNKIIHSVKQRFGFRTAELRTEDGFYLNGTKVIFKGVCRHSEWPTSGRTLSHQIHLQDILLMKSMNMNAVRMSHYPPDRDFLDLCDSLGLFVLDELTGWQAAYDTIVGRRLVKELVIRDVNHPSIVLWDNGNEGGWNRALDNDYALYDPQKRHVIHPWERFNGTNTKHYPDFKYIQKEIANAKEVFFPTEFMHGLFDGGQGAALDDFWKEMMKHPHAAGGFLWSFHDEGIIRGDRHDSIDVAGNQAPDGIVGPHREKEGSYNTVKEIWSPVYIESNSMNRRFDGRLEIENRYFFTNLDSCKFEWKLFVFPKTGEQSTKPKLLQKGFVQLPGIAPGEKGLLNIPFIADHNADALYLIAYDAKADTICTWSWALKSPEAISKASVAVAESGITTTKENKQSLTVTCDGISYYFDKKTGFLEHVFNGKKNISFGGGPALAGNSLRLKIFKYSLQMNTCVVEPSYYRDSLRVKWTIQKGKLPMLEYSYRIKDTSDFQGITFNYPENKINGMKWMGRGPYRVWKNRLKGQQLGVWEKPYNNTITGENWNYPEFKGWYSELYWMRLENKEADFTIYSKQENIFLEMLKPEKPGAASNNNTSPPFPEGNIGFMHAISAIGTKFQKAELMGPQSAKNIRQNNLLLTGGLYFDFR